MAGANKNAKTKKKKLTKGIKTSKTGTKVRFMPDDTIFSTTNFSYTTICERMQESAFLLQGLSVEIIDEEDNRHATFYYENGLQAFVENLNEDKKVLHKVVEFNGSKDKIDVALAFQYNESYNENIVSFVNNVKTIDGGSHEVGLKTALTKVFNDYARNNGFLKAKDKNLEGPDTREGLTAILSLKIPENLLQFEGQTKGKLGTPSARPAVENIVSEKLQFFLEENKDVATKIVEKMIKSKSVREAARKARDEARNGKDKGKKERIINGKLTPAQSQRPQVVERGEP